MSCRPDEMPSLPSPVSRKRVSVVCSTYKDDFLADLRDKELTLREERQKEKDGTPYEPITWSDDDWQDREEMFAVRGHLVEVCWLFLQVLNIY